MFHTKTKQERDVYQYMYYLFSPMAILFGPGMVNCSVVVLLIPPPSPTYNDTIFSHAL